MLRLACLLLALLPTLPALADGLPPGVADALKAAGIPASRVAVVVQPVDAAQPLVAHNAALPMNPASVMKLVTTYAALDLLGPAYTWKTTVWTDALPVDGTLEGNLYLRGGGDPRFAIENLWGLLRQARVRGIQRIAGDIVLDRSAFDVAAVDPGAFDDKPMRPYNVGPDALLINFRAMRFSILTDSGQPRILAETPSQGLRIDNRLRLASGECGDWREGIATRLVADNGGSRLEFSGPYPALCGEKTFNLAPLPADAQADGLIRALWSELGGRLDGRVRPGGVPPGASLLIRHESAPLAEIVRDINKYSNNVMARQVFVTLGGEINNDNGAGSAPTADAIPAPAPPATVARARQRVADWLASRHLRFDELSIENGSGLSRSARISAGSLDRLLIDAWKSPVMAEFIASLPIAGIDGTMRKRLKDKPAAGHAHIKTGTLDGVKTAAGYVVDSQGRRNAVVFLINDPRAKAGGPAIDALIDWVSAR